MNDAKLRLINAISDFQVADEAARSRSADVDKNSFKRIIDDLDAAMPGLEGLFLGRAKVLRAHAIWWVHRLTPPPKFYDPRKPRDPLLIESHDLAVEGRRILESFDASPSDIKWADDLVAKTDGPHLL